VAEAISSVIAQTFRDWELLVVDDCSPDGTLAAAQEAAAGDARVIPFQSPANGGPAAARNRGLERACGRYIAFLDCDDWWLPEKLERQLWFMESRKAHFSFTAYRRISEDGTEVGRQIGIPARLDYASLLGNTAIVTSTVLIDRQATGDFRMKKTYYDDFAAWLEVTGRGYPAYGLPEDLVRYRVVGQSVSRNKVRSVIKVWAVYREVEGLGLLRSVWSLFRYVVRASIKYSRF
jgi:teichuronic acid biosynthesis glycosyltransferase TuaG